MDAQGCNLDKEDIVASPEQLQQPMTVDSSSHDENDTNTITLLHKIITDSVFSATNEHEPSQSSDSSDYDYDSDPGTAMLIGISYKTTKETRKASRKVQYVKRADSWRKVSEYKNAVYCRQQRLKRRLYIQSLERTVVQLRLDNNLYKSKVAALQKEIDLFSQEAVQLKTVLQNQCHIAKIFAAVSTVPGITVDPFVKCVNEDVANVISSNKQQSEPGVCLHIYNDVIYLRLCPFCNISSKSHSTAL